ncbi:acyltransferase [Croceicoccus sp. BE223]|uniref:acyltransferase family protein n=1 Tax=Croceicoccus sp. BE223 TaxID=2817716 RepID=UPI002863C3E9|nr:acyltransferase [Croceicoccus sp. BE223]MDR7102051.1 peptidoglycan/LPS O-acetylase OafA/YrhL [Croceicoccus sp. BE223]
MATAPTKVMDESLASDRQVVVHGWIDAMRIVAAFAVMVGHLRDMLWQDYAGDWRWAVAYAGTGLGHQAVIVFFVISGYWITASVMRRIDAPSFWPLYMIDRVTRLQVVLVAALALTFVVDKAGLTWVGGPLYEGTSGAHSVKDGIAQDLGLSSLVGNLAFGQGLFAPTFGSNAPLWSLAYEFWFYVCFPALFLLFARRRVTWALASVVVMALWPEVAFGFACWLAGAAVWWVVDSGRAGRARWPLLESIGASGAFLVTAVLASQWGGAASDLVLAGMFALLLLALFRSSARLPSAPLFLQRWGQTGSYSLYALHYPLALLLAAMTLNTLTAGARMSPGPLALAVLLVLVLVVFCAGLAFAALIEVRTPAVRRALRERVLRSGR